jgi:DNA-binding CsgD family transcriptional regulator
LDEDRVEKHPATQLAASVIARIRRGFALDVARSERVIGRVAIAGGIVGGILGLHQLLLPGEHIDVLWIALIAATLVTAFFIDLMTSVVTALFAALLIDVVLLEPRGSVLVSSEQDAFTLLIFLVVSLIGAWAVSQSRRSSTDSPSGGAVRVPHPLIEPLTDRECENLTMLGRGMSNREIAGELVVTENTVKTHLEHLYGKLGVPSRGRAVAEARRLGLLLEADD